MPGGRLPAYASYGGRLPPPLPTQIVPTVGPVAGGTLFGVPGTQLLGSTGVLFGGNPATEISIIGGGSMVQGRTPPAPLLQPGPVEVVLRHVTGDVVVPGEFTYTAAEDPPGPDPDPPDPDPDEGEAESEGGET